MRTDSVMLERPARSPTGAIVGRPKKKEPTRTLRVYERQVDAIARIAGSLGEDTSDFLEPHLDKIIASEASRSAEKLGDMARRASKKKPVDD